MKVSRWILGVTVMGIARTLAQEYFDIGAMLSPYNDNDIMNTDEIQALAAFKLAIEEVNADPNALPGYTVRGSFQSITTTASAITATLALTHTSFGAGVDISMGTLNAATTIMAIEIFAHYLLPHMVLSDTDSGLSLTTNYPYHLRVVPSTSYEVGLSFIMAIIIQGCA